MNKHAFKRPLLTVGLLALVGAVGAQTYYTHELARRVAVEESAGPPASMQTPAGGPWDPWNAMQADMQRMQAWMERMFDDAVQGGRGMPAGTPLPGGAKLTLEEQGSDYVVKADIPGARDSDIDVNLDGRLLSISSQTQGQERQSGDNGRMLRQESYTSSFQRAFTLPGPVEASGMHSQYQNGVLTVTIPKAG